MVDACFCCFCSYVFDFFVQHLSQYRCKILSLVLPVQDTAPVRLFAYINPSTQIDRPVRGQLLKIIFLVRTSCLHRWCTHSLPSYSPCQKVPKYIEILCMPPKNATNCAEKIEIDRNICNFALTRFFVFHPKSSSKFCKIDCVECVSLFAHFGRMLL